MAFFFGIHGVDWRRVFCSCLPRRHATTLSSRRKRSLAALLKLNAAAASMTLAETPKRPLRKFLPGRWAAARQPVTGSAADLYAALSQAREDSPSLWRMTLPLLAASNAATPLLAMVATCLLVLKGTTRQRRSWHGRGGCHGRHGGRFYASGGTRGAYENRGYGRTCLHL